MRALPDVHGRCFLTSPAVGMVLCDYFICGGLLSSLLFLPTDRSCALVLLGVLGLSRDSLLAGCFPSHTGDFSQTPTSAGER